MFQMQAGMVKLILELMQLYPAGQEKAGEHFLLAFHGSQPPANTWVEGDLVEEMLQLYAQASLTGKAAWFSLGRGLFRLMQARGEAAQDLPDPLAALEFCAQWFQDNLQCPEAQPWQFLMANPESAEIALEGHPLDCRFVEGFFWGLLNQYAPLAVQVRHSACRHKGDRQCRFGLTWGQAQGEGQVKTKS